MADGIKVHIYGDYDDKQVNKAIRDLQGLKTNATTATPAMGGMNKAMLGLGAAAAGFVSFGIVTDFLKDAAGAAIEDEKSVVALSKAMDNLGMSSKTAMAEEFINDLSLAIGIADDQLRPALQRLVTVTGDLTVAQDLLALSTDVAAATGKDLATVSLAMAKAANGNIGALTRLGVPLDANIIKTKDFAAATAVLSEKFGGQAEAAAQTYGGQIARLTVAADEAKEAIGYSLLNAVSSFTNELGGTDGAVGAVTALGDGVAGWVEDFSSGIHAITDATAALADFTGGMFGAEDGSSTMGAAFDAMGGWATVFTGTIGMAGRAYDLFNARNAEWVQASPDAADRLKLLAAGARVFHGDVTDAEMAVEELTAGVKDFQATISLSQSLDDFRTDLKNLGEDLGNGARKLTGYGDAAKANRDKLRDVFGSIPGIVQQMVDQGKISASEFDATVNKMSRDALRSFAANGFKRKDIEAWLGTEGIWVDPAKERVKAIAAAAAAAASAAGRKVGYDLGIGIGVGVASTSNKVQGMTRQLIRDAEAAARVEAESNSPSLLFARVGEDLSKGVAVGVAAATGSVTDASRAMVKSALDAAKSERDAAMAAMRGVSDSIVGQVLGNVGFSTTDAEGNALTPQQIVASILGSTANQQAAVTAIATNIGAKLPPELLAKILQMPPETAVALANYLGGAEGSAMLAQLTTNYATLATETETLLGTPMGLAWGKVGDQSARDMLIAARATIAELAPGFASFVRSQLSVGADVVASITGVAEGIAGKRAAGGPVSGGSTYLVGERGPELFTPSTSGTIIPNGGSMRSASAGNTYNITVQAGVGDPRVIGQQVVEYVKRFEAANGKVFAAA